MNLTVEKIYEAVGGTLYMPQTSGDEKALSGKSNHKQTGAGEASGVFIDSRLCGQNSVFVAIKGERSDGHDYIGSVFDKGALCVICEHLPEDSSNCGPCIVVKSSTEALKKLATYYRNTLDIKIVGIVGSMGKTSTKEMVASVLSQHYRTHKTSGNFNNEIGVPLTLLAIRDEHEVAVVEMGISDFGEMDRLGAMVRPDAVVMTNIGPCHLEFLHDLDGVLRAKSEVFRHIPEGGLVALNGADEKLRAIDRIDGCRICYFNTDVTGVLPNNSTISATNRKNLGLLGTEFTLITPIGDIKATVPLPGAHSVTNAQAAAAIGIEFGLSLEEIAKGIEQVKPMQGRGYIEKIDEFTVIDDCYNANPESVKAALDLLSNAEGRRCAILGDMFELGENSATLHAEVGKYAAGSELALAIFIGELSKNGYDAYNAYMAMDKQQKRASSSEKASERSLSAVPQAMYFKTLDTFFEMYGSIPFKKGDNILLKASHGMHFDKLLAFFKENAIL